MPYLQLDGVSLEFKARRDIRPTLKQFFLAPWRTFRQPTVTVTALRAVSLTIRENERVGIVGHNGAGKSTLLKVLAGIYPPTRGRRQVEGKISSLFDLNPGFEESASGWDNIRTACYLHGATPRTIRQRAQEIADLCELGDSLELPFGTWSSGMKLRLAFAIATSIEPELLLIDEVLSVGDLAFQNKVRARLDAMIEQAKILVAVSHDLSSLERICEWGIWLENGSVRARGPMKEITRQYTAHAQEKSRCLSASA